MVFYHQLCINRKLHKLKVYKRLIMNKNAQFINEILAGYTFKGESIILGGAMLDKENVPGTIVKAPLKIFNHHSLKLEDAVKVKHREEMKTEPNSLAKIF